MGLYLEPNEEKESWLLANAEQVQLKDIVYKDIDKDKVLVCLVDNFRFKAAGVVIDERELKAFTTPDDNRPKQWFLIHKDTAEEVAPEWAVYMK